MHLDVRPGDLQPVDTNVRGDLPGRIGASAGAARGTSAATSGLGWDRSMVEPSQWPVLVVDDDAGVRQSLRLCLESDGARVLGVGTTQGALEAVERGGFELVVLDLWLGSESGLDVTPEILHRQPGIAI